MVLRGLIFIGFLGFITACSKQTPDYQARITLFSSVPGSNNFSVAFAGQLLDTNLGFNQLRPPHSFPASTNFLAWKLNPAPSFEANFLTDLPNGSSFTLLFYDSVHQYKTAILKNNWPSKLLKEKSIVRFIPMIIGTDTLRLTNDTNRILLSNRKFEDFLAETGDYLPVDTMFTKLRLYNNRQLLDSIPNHTFKPNKAYTIYGVGVVGQIGDFRPQMVLVEHN